MSNFASAAAVSIVLVHGGFVDGSGWQGVYNILKKDGYSVSIVQNPTITLEGDVAAAKQVIDAQKGPVVLVGHSYGGVVITEAGNDPKVAGLVYVTAFAPDKGESVGSLIANPPPGAPVRPIVPVGDGTLLLDKAKFAASFAADVTPDEGSVHGRLAGAVGCSRAERCGDDTRVESEAQLVSRRQGRSHDPARRPAHDGETRECVGRRGEWQPCRLCLRSEIGCGPDRNGSQGFSNALSAIVAHITPLRAHGEAFARIEIAVESIQKGVPQSWIDIVPNRDRIRSR